MRPVRAALPLLVLIASACSANRPMVVAESPAIGERHRVLERESSGELTVHVGPLLAAESGTLLIFADSVSETVVPFDRVETVELSLGRSRMTGAGHGLAYGLLGGAAAGALLFVILYDNDDCWLICGTGPVATLGGVVGAVFGMPLGTIIGALVGKEQWQPVRYPPPGP